jgi:hypothetical protein
MKGMHAALVAALAVLAFSAPTANAESGRRVDHRITAVAIGVGTASSAGYFALNDWHFNHWNSARHGVTSFGAWGLTTVGCAALSPIVATAVLNRPLTYREAHILVASCFIPVIGGWLVNEAYNNHILWAPDEQPAPKPHRKRAK